jgi:hypothetical protein
MAITITLSPEDTKKLAERAAAAGQDVLVYVQQIVKRDIARPVPQDIDEILAPLREEFARSGISDEELLADINAARDEYRAESRKRTS